MTLPQARSGHDDHSAELSAAVEEHDLAIARLSWVKVCTCGHIAAQDEATRWHEAQVEATNERVSSLRAAVTRAP